MGTKWDKNRKTGTEMTNCLPPQILNISGLSKSQQKMTTSRASQQASQKALVGEKLEEAGGGAPPGPFAALRAFFLHPKGVQSKTLVMSMWANDDHVVFLEKQILWSNMKKR